MVRIVIEIYICKHSYLFINIVQIYSGFIIKVSYIRLHAHEYILGHTNKVVLITYVPTRCAPSVDKARTDFGGLVPPSSVHF